MDKTINLLKEKPIIIPKNLFCNYKKLGLDEKELIVVIFLINSDEVFNPMVISANLQMELKEVMQVINSLITKKIIEIETIKEKQIKEIINLNNLYEKIAILITNETTQNNQEIYSTFEKELGRTLAPSELTIIAEFKDNYNEELILLALKNAIINGVRNLRYIDTTLKNWSASGFKNKNDVEENQKKYKQDKERKPEIIDYDWLNEN